MCNKMVDNFVMSGDAVLRFVSDWIFVQVWNIAVLKSLQRRQN